MNLHGIYRLAYQLWSLWGRINRFIPMDKVFNGTIGQIRKLISSNACTDDGRKSDNDSNLGKNQRSYKQFEASSSAISEQHRSIIGLLKDLEHRQNELIQGFFKEGEVSALPFTYNEIQIAPGWISKLIFKDDCIDVWNVHANAGTMLDYHKHPLKETIHVTSGVCEVYIGDKYHLSKPGDVYVIPMNHSHKVVAVSDVNLIVTFLPPISVRIHEQ